MATVCNTSDRVKVRSHRMRCVAFSTQHAAVCRSILHHAAYANIRLENASQRTLTPL